MNISRMKRIDRRVPFHTSMKLDIGCGAKVADGYEGLDIVNYGQEYVWDIEEGLPFPDNSVFAIRCSHTLEHIQDVIGVMNEFHRVLRQSGQAYIIVPSKDHDRANVPTHTNFITEEYFKWFEREDTKEYGAYRWKITNIVTNSRKDIHVKMQPI